MEAALFKPSKNSEYIDIIRFKRRVFRNWDWDSNWETLVKAEKKENKKPILVREDRPVKSCTEQDLNLV
jgi:hypothetical protein